jgi:hypothetical protein
MQDIKRFEHAGLTIRICPDKDPQNPRDWDNLGTMILFHRRRTLGDKHNLTVDGLKELVMHGDVIWVPVYGYDHGGITIRTRPFDCPWDSGQLGYIYVEREKALKEFGAKRLTDRLERRIQEALRLEVDVYDRYLNGGFTGYIVEDVDGEHLDSCWGFDDPDYCEAQARESAERIAASAKEAMSLCAE